MNEVWRIELLGSLVALRSNQRITRFRTQKTGALLAYLAYFPGQHTRQALIEILWPDVSPRTGANNLSLALSSLRRQLEPPDTLAGSLILATRNTVELRPSLIETDVDEFERACDESRFDEAVRLYRGSLLAGFYESWIPLEEQRLEARFIAALNQLIAQREAAGDTAGALEAAYHGARVAPMNAEPVETIERLTGRKISSRFPRSRSTRQGRALPPLVVEAGREGSDGAMGMVAPTQFFGRQEELNWLLNQLHSPQVRLITLLGHGGSGKTRLSLETMRRWACANETQRPVYFVSLAEVSSTRRLADSIFDALQLTRLGVISPLDAIISYLQRETETLLVLDNFEQLVPQGVEVVARLVREVPHLKCLVTSRTELALSEETPFPVRPLPTPHLESHGENGNFDLPRLMEWPGVQLFTDRAQMARPDFQVTQRNAQSVVELCARLEGLPLAIELAAARTVMFSPGQMLKRFAQRLDLAQKPTRRNDWAPRHASLRATLDWSFQLLSPACQKFLPVLSVFVGGWTAESAKAVSQQENAEILLEELRAASLISREASASGVRYSFLETVREFAGEQLIEHAGENGRENLKRRHADYFESIAVHSQPSGEDSWIWTLRAESDNLRAALNWTLMDNPEQALRIAANLFLFWESDSRLSEGREWLELALRQTENQKVPTALKAKALFGLGHLLYTTGEFQESLAFLEESLELYRQVQDEPGEARVLCELSLSFMNLNDPRTRETFEMAVPLAHRSGDDMLRWTLIYYYSMILAGMGDTETSLVWSQLSLDLGQKLNDARAEAIAHEGYGIAQWAAGHIEVARHHLELSRADVTRLGTKFDTLRVVWILGHIARQQNRLDEAKELWLALFDIAQDMDIHYMRLYTLESFAPLAVSYGDMRFAARMLGAADALRESLGIPMLAISNVYVAPAVIAVRDALGEEHYNAELAVGRKLEPKEALAECAQSLSSYEPVPIGVNN